MNGFYNDELIEGYFNTYESHYHLDAKEKLFELIKSKRIKIKDQFGNSYSVFENNHSEEFLHVESFVMDYSNEALFSNKETPCKKYNEIKPLCKQEGYFGAYKELPCAKCILNSVGDIDKSSKYASYRPDVSYGYEGVHKIWFEIKHTNKSSYNKMRFCHENDIVLLEIDSNTVEDFNEYNGELIFERLIYDPVEFDTSEYDLLIDNEIKKKGYITTTELKHMLHVDKFKYTFKKYANHDMYDQLVKKNGLVEYYDGNKGICEHFGFKGKKKILVRECDVSKLNRIKDEYNKMIKYKIENIVKDLVDETRSKGFMLQKEFKDTASKLIPTGHKTELNIENVIDEHNLVSVYVEEYYDDLIKLGVEPTNIRKKVLVPRETFKNFNR